MNLNEWKEMPWWPSGRSAGIRAGWAGHEREIVLSIDGYDHLEQIPAAVSEMLAAELSSSWLIENRGTRIEIHPSGRFAGGFQQGDAEAVTVAAKALGLTVDYVDIAADDLELEH